MMSARVAFVPRPRSSISSISLPWLIRVAVELQRLATGELRDLVVGRSRVGVDRREARIEDDRSAHEVGLRARLDVGTRRLGDHRLREGGEEAPRDQLVDAALGAAERLGINALSGMDRGMIGRLLAAPGGLES